MQKFLTSILKAKLIKNGIDQRAQRDATDGEKDIDFEPVVKFFNPVGAATWLISEISPDNPDLMFGLCDLGMQSPELGDVSIREMLDIRLMGGLRIERDYHFKANKTLSAYADAAREAGSIQA